MKIFTAMIAAAAIFGATTASAEVLDPKGIKTTGEYNEHGTKYPVTGFRGLPWSMHWEDMKDQGTTQSNRYKRLLTWAEDNGVEIDAVPNTEYSYTTVVGPGAPLEAKNMWAGTFSFEPGAVYGVGQHASWEIYLVVKGQADFYNYDKVTHAKEGTWIITRPFDPHGIKNTSETEDLEIAWFWWNEDPNRPNWATGGLPFQPAQLWIGRGLDPELKPSDLPAEPTGDDRFKYMYASEDEVQ